MSSLQDNTRKAIEIFECNLVEGNHDTITLFGNQAQMKLRDYSRAVSKLLQRNDDDLDTAIEDAVFGIEKFDVAVNLGKRRLFGRVINHRAVYKAYRKTVLYIERVSELFLLQQAQLLKDVKFMEKLDETVDESIILLESYIQTGKSFITKWNSDYRSATNRFPEATSSLESEELDNWYLRLERRINDLCISHTLALQSKKQITLLKNNNLTLIDTISSAISNTFPLWQNQMSTSLEISKLEKCLRDHTLLTLKEVSRQPSKETISDESNVIGKANHEDISRLNSELKETLTEVASLEKQDQSERKKLTIL